jgi:hypothetical protein
MRLLDIDESEMEATAFDVLVDELCTQVGDFVAFRFVQPKDHFLKPDEKEITFVPRTVFYNLGSAGYYEFKNRACIEVLDDAAKPDVIGVVIKLSQIIEKDMGYRISRRRIVTICDETRTCVDVCVFVNNDDLFKNVTLNGKTLVAVKSCDVVRTFGGASCGSISLKATNGVHNVSLNPTSERATALREW